MGDSTMLYGLLGSVSPQPLLYFSPNHAFLDQQIPHLDGMIIASLQRNNVTVIIREKVTYEIGTYNAYPRFPRTWAWMTSCFRHALDLGNYEIWELASCAR
jgi:hypothetical protein